MASDVTRPVLRGRIRDAGDYQAPFITDTMLNNWINDSLAKLWELIIKHDPSRVLSTQTVVVVSGTASYSLATDYYRIKGVAVEDSSRQDGWAPLERYMWPERHADAYSSDKLTTQWDVQEKKLYLWPKPQWSANVLVEYFRTAPSLTADTSTGSTVDSVNLWTEWLIFDVLVKCAAKGKDLDEAKIWSGERDRCERLIVGSTPQVKGGGPRRIVSVYGDRSARSRYRRSRSAS